MNVKPDPSFFVPGLPVAKGSARAFINKHSGRAVVMQTNSDKQRPWASSITFAATQYGIDLHRSAVHVQCHFVMPRPKSHYRGKLQTLRPDAPFHHTGKPDLDKLVRLVLDALTGVAYSDDSTVAMVSASKRYGDRPGVQITVGGMR